MSDPLPAAQVKELEARTRLIEAQAKSQELQNEIMEMKLDELKTSQSPIKVVK